MVVEGQNDGRNLLFGMALCDIFPEWTFVYLFNEAYRHKPETEPADGEEILYCEQTRCVEYTSHINAELVPRFFLTPTLIYIVGTSEI